METDEIDEAIIALLQEDGRLSNRAVGRELGVSEGTVRQRLKKLQDSGAIRMGVVIDPTRLGVNVHANVLVAVEPSRLEHAIQAFSKLKEASYVACISGRFNVHIILAATNPAELGRLINSQIERFSGVHDVSVRLIVGVAKHEYHLINIPASR